MVEGTARTRILGGGLYGIITKGGYRDAVKKDVGVIYPENKKKKRLNKKRLAPCKQYQIRR